MSRERNGHVIRVVSRRNSQSVTELRPCDFAHDLFPDRTRRTEQGYRFGQDSNSRPVILQASALTTALRKI